MAVRGHPCGFELAKRDASGFTGMGQDLFETIYGQAAQPDTTRKHSGNNSILLSAADALYLVTGQAEPFSASATKKWWTGFHSPKAFATPAAADVVLICQLTDDTFSDGKWLVLCGLVSLTGGVYYFQYRLSILTMSGGVDSYQHLITHSTTINPLAVGNSDWYMFTIEYDVTAGSVELFIGLNTTATSVASPVTLSAAQKSGLQLDAYMCPDTRTGAGKGASLLAAYFDDLFPNDDQNGGLTTRPTYDIGVVKAAVSGGAVQEIASGTVYGAGVALSGTSFQAGLSGSLLSYTDALNGDDTGGSAWYGRYFALTPESTPQAWSTALFNTLDVNYQVEWVNVIGSNLVLVPLPELRSHSMMRTAPQPQSSQLGGW